MSLFLLLVRFVLRDIFTLFLVKKGGLVTCLDLTTNANTGVAVNLSVGSPPMDAKIYNHDLSPKKFFFVFYP